MTTSARPQTPTSPRRRAAALAGATAVAGLGTLGFSRATADIQPASRPVTLDVALDTPTVLAGTAQHAYMRVALKGAELAASRKRTTANLAIVLDHSGSMTGEKLAQARQAAIMAIDRLAPDDVVSVVVYDDTVDVLVPARRVGDGSDLRARIASIEAGGSTALFAGVAKGAAELRRYLSAERVNRVILLSDGIANVGPSSPSELADLGISLGREGIAVTTIGLGLDYNEDLMTRLASASDGNHFFAERAEDLASAYETELGEVMSVIAQEVDVDIHFAAGVRPVRVLGREAEIHGQTVVGRLNQLYARQTKYFVVEVELPAGKDGASRNLATVEVGFHDLASGAPAALTATLDCRFSAQASVVEALRNPRVTAAVARQIGTETNRNAMDLRDQGKIAEARLLLMSNAAYLEKTAATTDSEHLAKDAAANRNAADNLDAARWKKQRKVMTKEQTEQLQALGYVE